MPTPRPGSRLNPYSAGDFVSPSGWRQKQAAAEARRAAEEAKRNSPEQIEIREGLRLIAERDRLAEVLRKAKEHRVLLITKQNAAISMAAQMDHDSYRRGVVADGRPRVQAQIEGLPRMIERADAEIAEAQAALDAHLARMATAAAEAAAEPVTAPAKAPAKAKGRN